MAKSYRVELACPHMDHTEWVVMENLYLSLEGILNTQWEFDCPLHGTQHEKPLQAEEKREGPPKETGCSVEGCPNIPIGVVEGHAFCGNHFILTCHKQLDTYYARFKERRWREVSLEALAEFFLDYLLRKVMAKPPEYTQWPPALRLFYRFLSEKGYLDDPEPLIAGLYAIEPDFIALVQQRS